MKRKLLVILLSLAMLLTFTPMAAFADTGGYWSDDHMFYYLEEGVQAEGWQNIDGETYYFDPNNGGALVKGWIEYENERYFADNETGAILKGWQIIYGGKFYLDPRDGRAHGGGVDTIDGSLYIFHDDGSLMWGGWIEDTDDYGNTYHYYANDDGVLQTGWQEIEGDTYYFDTYDGHMYAGGVYQIDDRNYIFNEYGMLQSAGWDDTHTHYYYDDATQAYGITEIEGNWYYFDEYTGELLKGLTLLPAGGEFYVYYSDEETGVLKSGWQKVDGDEYYFQSYDDNNPFRAYTGLTEIDGDAYYFSMQGVMRYGWIETPYWMTDSSGEAYLAGYDRYYADHNGRLLTGWQEIDGNTYYFYEDYYHAYADGRYYIDGTYCTFDENGVLIKRETPDPVLVSKTLWAGCEYYGPGSYDGDVTECTLVDVTSDDPDIIEVHLDEDFEKMYDYYLKPLKEGETEITVWYTKDGELKHTTNVFTVKPFPQFLDGVTIDGEELGYDEYEGINYLHIYDYDGTTTSVKLDPAEGWYLDDAYGFTDGDNGGSNIQIETDDIGSGWTFDFPEDQKRLYAFFYFVNEEDPDEEIMFSIQIHRYSEGEDGGDGPYVPAGGYWDESHTHYYYDYGDLARGVSCIKEDGAYNLYYFDEKDGTLKTGWIKDSGTWEDEETGQTGTWENWYYGDPATGKLATGWKKIGNYWYYFTEPDLSEGWNGYLPALHNYGKEKIDGKWYYLTPDSGRMGTGWIEDKHTYDYGDGYVETWTNWYYANSSGVLQSGWLQQGSKWYYLEPREEWDYGLMYTGNRLIDGKSYLFGNGGIMQSGGWVKETGSWEDEAGKTHTWTNWYYAASNGVLTEGWKQLGGKWYYFQKSGDGSAGGYMFNNDVYRIDNKFYAFTKDGAMGTGWVKFEWLTYNYDGTYSTQTYWAYANSSGIAQTGWQKISGSWYYFSDWGIMYANEWAKDNKGYCWMESSGKLSTATKWVKYEGEWYYIEKGYRVQNAWRKDSKGWCWLTEDGSMLTNGWAKDSKGWCWIASNGYMPEKTMWVQYEGDWYYIEKGYRAQNKWAKDSKGWCYLGSDGKMVTNDFVKDSKGWCWIGDAGYMIEEDMWVMNGDYYIEKGYKAVNKTLVIDGVTYEFDADGNWIIVE